MWETARTPFDRGLEYLEAFRKGDKESPLVEHDEEYHGGMGAEFSMKILENPRSNLLRHISEYHTMVEYGGMGLLLNRR